MRKKYHRNYRHGGNSILGLTRNEKMAFDMIIETFSLLSKIIVFTVKGLYKMINYFIKTTKNMYSLQNIGYNIEDLNRLLYNLSPRGFEVFIAELYKAKGYDVELTQETNDYGRDVIIKTNEGDIFIECKKYNENGEPVGREICQKLLGSMQMLKAKKGIVCTTGKFHRNAYEVERMVDNLELMDTKDIMCMLMELDSNKINKILLKAKNIA
jgi:HJR/Mrr/RecB family endonuclease